MLDIPEVKYARTGGVAVAYQVLGEGPRRLALTPFLSNLVTIWQLPALRSFFERLASETTLTMINPRGMGLSDRPRTVTIEGWMDDIRTVLDAEESNAARCSAPWTARTLPSCWPPRIPSGSSGSSSSRRFRGS
jgi:hypothetical protein